MVVGTVTYNKTETNNLVRHKKIIIMTSKRFQNKESVETTYRRRQKIKHSFRLLDALRSSLFFIEPKWCEIMSHNALKVIAMRTTHVIRLSKSKPNIFLSSLRVA